MTSSQPTIFHLTHWKAGSQWVAEILKSSALERFILPQDKVAHFLQTPIVPGFIYPTVYVPYPKFEAIVYPQVAAHGELDQAPSSDTAETQNWRNFVLEKKPTLKFFVIRDLRDAMISRYFSVKVSHAVLNDTFAAHRQELNTKNFEDGFISTLNRTAPGTVAIQKSWVKSCARGETLLVRYEDLIADEQAWFAKIIEHCQIDISSGNLADIVANNSFAKRTGRVPGMEQVDSHYRKGIAGDWKNYFTDSIKAEFKQKFGQVLIDTGYEKDLNW